MPSTQTLAFVGLVLAGYAIYVEYRHHNEAEEETPFLALCDIEVIGASCSKTFALPQGKLLSYFGLVDHGSILDLPNAALGMAYYIFLLVGAKAVPSNIVLLASVVAMTFSVYLAYSLTVLSELCILCWSTHVINGILLWNTLRQPKIHLKKNA